MSYRLKDKELQKKLDTLSNENRFSEQLQKVCESEYADLEKYVCVKFGKDFLTGYKDYNGDESVNRFYACILKNDIEQYKDYNPKGWNKFSEIEPPEGVWMRLNIFRSNTREQHLYRKAAKYVHGAWRFESGEEIHLEDQDDICFCPWGDNEE